jgi:molybdate transport system substrate-binding protein
MTQRRTVLIALACAALIGSGRCFAVPGATGKVLVSAASSLTDVLRALQPDAERSIGASILLNFGGSGTLRKQIEEGAPVDLFFSAASEDMDRLEKGGLLLRSSRVDLLSNSLVMVGGPESSPAASFAELRNLLASSTLVAIGNPDSVPAGRYAIQALRAMGLLPLVEGRLVRGGSVREVLQFVQSGSVPIGFVFLTDALSLPAGGETRMLYKVPSEVLGVPILYPAAVIAASRNAPTALKLLEFLRGDEARDVFTKAGFTIK